MCIVARSSPTPNDQARLIVSETRTTDADIATLVVAHLKREGFHITEKREG